MSQRVVIALTHRAILKIDQTMQSTVNWIWHTRNSPMYTCYYCQQNPGNSILSQSLVPSQFLLSTMLGTVWLKRRGAHSNRPIYTVHWYRQALWDRKGSHCFIKFKEMLQKKQHWSWLLKSAWQQTCIRFLTQSPSGSNRELPRRLWYQGTERWATTMYTHRSRVLKAVTEVLNIRILAMISTL